MCAPDGVRRGKDKRVGFVTIVVNGKLTIEVGDGAPERHDRQSQRHREGRERLGDDARYPLSRFR